MEGKTMDTSPAGPQPGWTPAQLHTTNYYHYYYDSMLCFVKITISTTVHYYCWHCLL